MKRATAKNYQLNSATHTALVAEMKLGQGITKLAAIATLGSDGDFDIDKLLSCGGDLMAIVILVQENKLPLASTLSHQRIHNSPGRQEATLWMLGGAQKKSKETAEFVSDLAWSALMSIEKTINLDQPTREKTERTAIRRLREMNIGAMNSRHAKLAKLFSAKARDADDRKWMDGALIRWQLHGIVDQKKRSDRRNHSNEGVDSKLTSPPIRAI